MQVTLVMFTADGQRREFPLTKPTTMIGRKPTCNLRIPIFSVSREHCRVDVQGKRVIVHDLGSSNGTFVNHKRIQEAPLSPGDLLTIGPVHFTVTVDGKPAKVKPVKTILPDEESDDVAAAGAAAAGIAQEDVEELPAAEFAPAEDEIPMEEAAADDDEAVVMEEEAQEETLEEIPEVAEEPPLAEEPAEVNPLGDLAEQAIEEMESPAESAPEELSEPVAELQPEAEVELTQEEEDEVGNATVLEPEPEESAPEAGFALDAGSESFEPEPEALAEVAEENPFAALDESAEEQPPAEVAEEPAAALAIEEEPIGIDHHEVITPTPAPAAVVEESEPVAEEQVEENPLAALESEEAQLPEAAAEESEPAAGVEEFDPLAALSEAPPEEGGDNPFADMVEEPPVAMQPVETEEAAAEMTDTEGDLEDKVDELSTVAEVPGEEDDSPPALEVEEPVVEEQLPDPFAAAEPEASEDITPLPEADEPSAAEEEDPFAALEALSGEEVEGELSEDLSALAELLNEDDDEK